MVSALPVKKEYVAVEEGSGQQELQSFPFFLM